jgi:hypothetical protein
MARRVWGKELIESRETTIKRRVMRFMGLAS